MRISDKHDKVALKKQHNFKLGLMKFARVVEFSMLVWLVYKSINGI